MIPRTTLTHTTLLLKHDVANEPTAVGKWVPLFFNQGISLDPGEEAEARPRQRCTFYGCKEVGAGRVIRVTAMDIAFIEPESPRCTLHWMRGSSASPREHHDSCRRDQRHAHRSHRPWVRTIRALRRWVGMCQLPGPP